MGILTNKMSKDDLKPGDHIYSWRTAHIYAHHGIYVGDNMVIHFTGRAGQGTGAFLGSFLVSSPSTTATRCSVCGDQSNSQGVIKSCMDCFLSGCKLYQFRYSVSPSFFLAEVRGGTCALASSDTTDTVLHRANYLLNNGFGRYHMFKNNCEDFAIYCKTGLVTTGQGSNNVPRSGQVTAALTAALTAFTSSLGRGLEGFAAGMHCASRHIARSRQLRSVTEHVPLEACTAALTAFASSLSRGLAGAPAGMYCASRYVYDVGVRSDAVKVDVERLAAYMGGSIS